MAWPYTFVLSEVGHMQDTYTRLVEPSVATTDASVATTDLTENNSE